MGIDEVPWRGGGGERRRGRQREKERERAGKLDRKRESEGVWIRMCYCGIVFLIVVLISFSEVHGVYIQNVCMIGSICCGCVCMQVCVCAWMYTHA
jgi:hypothetical protein